jgi:hypothetical protein
MLVGQGARWQSGPVLGTSYLYRVTTLEKNAINGLCTATTLCLAILKAMSHAHTQGQ